jgi:hypothetical protein
LWFSWLLPLKVFPDFEHGVRDKPDGQRQDKQEQKEHKPQMIHEPQNGFGKTVVHFLSLTQVQVRPL